jgi:transposase InsO family protein
VVHTLRTDRGGELTSTALVDWCGINGIKHELSPPYVPKANGLIERFHGAVMPLLRAVHAERKLPLAAIAELFMGLVYLKSRLPNSAIQDRIPSEKHRAEELTSLAHLRVLGANCYMVVPDVRGKLAPRSSPSILVGYEGPGRGKNAEYRT